VAGKRGRDQRAPMERLVRLAAVLHTAGEDGVPGPKLLEVTGFTGQDGMRQLERDIKALTIQGWQIENVGTSGTTARFRMRSVDNRLRVALSPAQQRELRRAVLLVNRANLADQLGLESDERPADVEADLPVGVHDVVLATVLRALRLGCLLRYRYNGTERVVHPQSVTTQYGKWYLRGREDAGDLVKAFVVGRMTNLRADEPGTAKREPEAAHPGLHPMTWEIDPPVEVTLRTTSEYRPDVQRSLGLPAAAEELDGVVELRYTVTNRSALRGRIYELGPRVELVGPADVRREVIGELTAIAHRSGR